jgi:predicted negative regulator of RcsB-dependent stress response
MENMNSNNVNVNEQQTTEVAQVENKKSVLKGAMNCLTNKYTLIGLGTAIIGAAGWYGWKAWKAKRAAAANTKDADFEDVTNKK